jgi:transposase InsO family protein
MREAGLSGLSRPKRRVKTTDSAHDQPIAQNKLERNFTAEKPDQKWVSDLTYLPTTEGWLYLAVVLDLFSRRVVGWAFSSSLESRVVLDALRMACQQRCPGQGLVFHSDRGVQYASFDFRQALSRLEAVQSMSRKGNCWDNAPCESFFSTLKLELGLDVPIGSRAVTERLVFEWIEVFYNWQRLHSRLGGCSPVSFEESRVAA